MPELATLVCDDVLHWAETTPPIGAHALIADPPYELNFMSSKWDRTGIAFQKDTWTALARHLLPGAFLLVFGSSRGWHRLACALEDAGLVSHPSVFMLSWVQSSGFPKATRIDSQIDREAGMEQEVIGERLYADGKKRPNQWTVEGSHEGWKRPAHEQYTGNRVLTAPATPLAQTWAGHRYGGQVLKPSVEPVLCFQKPYQGRPVDSIVRTGAGALNIEAGRIGGVSDTRRPKGEGAGAFPHSDDAWQPHLEVGGHVGKRWPPNLVLVHLDTCVELGVQRVPGTHHSYDRNSNASMWGLGRTDDPRQGYAAPDGTEAVQQYQCAPGCVVAALERQAGESVSTASGHRGRSQIWGSCDGTEMPRNGYDDSGSVSRFFATMDWSLDVAEQLAQAAPAYYEPKASRAERDAGLEGMPLYSAADLTGRIPGRAGLQFPSRPHANGGNPYAGISGGSRHNSHPTVKPLTLLKWLATLLLPPAAYAPRRILCPFSGSGSEVIGAILAGWEHVTGIEQDPAYVQLARRRLAYWTGYRAPDPDPGTDPAPVASDGPAGQLALF